MGNHAIRLYALPLMAMSLLTFVAHVHGARARPAERFAEAQIYLELNDTDGDLGIHASIDGEPWTHLDIEGPSDVSLLRIVSRNQLHAQGLTQVSFESAEPPFDELDPSAFLQRFPEGRYEIEGRAQDGGTIESTAVLSHVLAAPPENITLSGVLAADSCDAEPIPAIGAPVHVRWDPVTRSHPEIGRRGPVKVSRYQLFVEGDGVTFGVDLPPSVTAIDIPAAITQLEREFKLEIIVRTADGNNTAVESCFRVI